MELLTILKSESSFIKAILGHIFYFFPVENIHHLLVLFFFIYLSINWRSSGDYGWLRFGEPLCQPSRVVIYIMTILMKIVLYLLQIAESCLSFSDCIWNRFLALKVIDRAKDEKRWTCFQPHDNKNVKLICLLWTFYCTCLCILIHIYSNDFISYNGLNILTIGSWMYLWKASELGCSDLSLW